MKIHLIRHGETIWHEENKYSGLSDIDLNANGYLQSERLSNWAVEQPIQAIYTSFLKRSIETADPTCRKLGIESTRVRNFNEVNFGKIEGLSPQKFKSDFPLSWQEFQENPASSTLPGGEAGVLTVSRALTELDLLFKETNLQEIMIVCHGTLIRLMLSRLLGLEIDNYRKVFPTIENCKINTLHLPVDWNTGINIGSASLIRYNGSLSLH